METDGPTSRWLSSTVICVYMSSVMFLQAVTHASSQKVWNKQISIMTWRWQTLSALPVRPCFPAEGPRSAHGLIVGVWAWRALWRVVCSPSDSSPLRQQLLTLLPPVAQLFVQHPLLLIQHCGHIVRLQEEQSLLALRCLAESVNLACAELLVKAWRS